MREPHLTVDTGSAVLTAHEALTLSDMLVRAALQLRQIQNGAGA